jgi:serine-type D-Ala-D-Ala carboxypeptidase (penicillin-binding protein 5/6)
VTGSSGRWTGTFGAMSRRRLTTALFLGALAVTACSSGRGSGTVDGGIDLPALSSVVVTERPVPSRAPTTSRAATTIAPVSTTTAVPAATAAPTTVAPSTAAPAPPSTTVPTVDAKAYAVFDMRAGEVLAAKRANAQLPVGSLMKLLTAQVAYAAGQPTKVVTIPDNILVDPEESNIELVPGEEFPRDVLIRAMLIVSANDAARALADDIAGGEDAYAALMNTAAEELGLRNTRAVNVTGLDAAGQHSSAKDMITLGTHLMTNPSFQLTVNRVDAVLHDLRYPTTNDLLNLYPGADGIKSGHTTEAGWCLLGSASRGGQRIVVAVLGAPTEEARNDAVISLLNWGFRQ